MENYITVYNKIHCEKPYWFFKKKNELNKKVEFLKLYKCNLLKVTELSPSNTDTSLHLNLLLCEMKITTHEMFGVVQQLWLVLILLFIISSTVLCFEDGLTLADKAVYAHNKVKNKNQLKQINLFTL